MNTWLVVCHSKIKLHFLCMLRSCRAFTVRVNTKKKKLGRGERRIFWFALRHIFVNLLFKFKVNLRHFNFPGWVGVPLDPPLFFFRYLRMMFISIPYNYPSKSLVLMHSNLKYKNKKQVVNNIGFSIYFFFGGGG